MRVVISGGLKLQVNLRMCVVFGRTTKARRPDSMCRVLGRTQNAKNALHVWCLRKKVTKTCDFHKACRRINPNPCDLMGDEAGSRTKIANARFMWKREGE